MIAAFPEAKRLVPALRMVVVAGPAHRPGLAPAHDGLEVRAFVHDLYRHLAACDLAVVQGGLTTCMELTADRPAVPATSRCATTSSRTSTSATACDRYRRRPPDGLRHRPTPDVIAAAIAAEIGREVDYRPVETDGAARAACAARRAALTPGRGAVTIPYRRLGHPAGDGAGPRPGEDAMRLHRGPGPLLAWLLWLATMGALRGRAGGRRCS